MGKDYANRKKPAQRRRQTKTQPKPQGLPGWLWLLVGMTFGLVIAVMLYVFNGPDSGGRALPSAPTPRASTPPPTPEPELPPKEEARFTFYEMLPNFQLVPRTESTPRPPRPLRICATPFRPAASPGKGMPKRAAPRSRYWASNHALNPPSLMMGEPSTGSSSGRNPTSIG